MKNLLERLSTLLALAILLAAVVSTVQADTKIYRTTDAEGNVVFTDIPPRTDEPSEAVTIETPNTFAIEEALGPKDAWIVDPADGQAEEGAAFSYKSIAIQSPANDEAVRENAGNVTIVTIPNPDLRAGDRVRLLLDGKRMQEGAQTTFVLQNVDRGTHSAAVEIIDDQGKVLVKSKPSVFHLQRYAIRPRAGPA